MILFIYLFHLGAAAHVNAELLCMSQLNDIFLNRFFEVNYK